MPTSGVTTFTLTARDAITKALHETKVTPLGEDPEAEEMEDGIFALNTMLKAWQTKGLSQWSETAGTVTQTGGEVSGALPANIRDIVSASVGSPERPITKVSRGEYFNIPNKDATGTPSMFYVARQREAAVMYLWPVPATDTDITIYYERRLDTITNASETIDFPEEYTGALIANLAVQLGTKYGAELSPELVARARDLREAMFDDDRPESYTVGNWAYN